MKFLMIEALAIIFACVETRFFGNNWVPTTPPEVMADGIAVIIAAIGITTL